MITSKDLNTIRRIKFLEEKQTPNRKFRRQYIFGIGKEDIQVKNNRKTTKGRRVQLIGTKVIRHKIQAA